MINSVAIAGRSGNRLQIALARAVGIVVRERRVFSRPHQAKVAEHAGDLVVAHQLVPRAAGGLGGPLEPPHQIERLPRVVAAVDDIAQLDDVGPSSDPTQLAVHDAGDLQDFDKSVVGAVHVADGDHALDVVPLARAGGRNLRRREGEERDDDDGSERRGQLDAT